MEMARDAGRDDTRWEELLSARWNVSGEDCVGGRLDAAED
jgi:hypothetical protein